MRNNLTTGAWQYDIECPTNNIFLSTSVDIENPDNSKEHSMAGNKLDDKSCMDANLVVVFVAVMLNLLNFSNCLR